MQDIKKKDAALGPLVTTIILIFFSAITNTSSNETYQSDLHEIRVKKVAGGFSHPWGLAFLPAGGFLVTERIGSLRVVSGSGVVSEPITGLPEIASLGQGGLMDIVLHPDFSANSVVFMSFVGERNGLLGTEVVRGKLIDGRLISPEIVFRALPKSKGGRHFGSRLSFLKDGSLLVSLGDRGYRPNGQDLSTHPGSIVRIDERGNFPSNNPFIRGRMVRPEIYTFGNRNVQGLFWDELTNNVWATEHGPQGGCELNLIKSGLNYGWAEITFGKNYIIGTKIGEGYSREDVEAPAFYWTPSNAPSGLTLYRGSAFSAWNGNLFVGSLKFRGLSRLTLEGETVTKEERILEGKIGRVRTVMTGPDGFIYILTDDPNGQILMLQPSF